MEKTIEAISKLLTILDSNKVIFSILIGLIATLSTATTGLQKYIISLTNNALISYSVIFIIYTFITLLTLRKALLPLTSSLLECVKQYRYGKEILSTIQYISDMQKVVLEFLYEEPIRKSNFHRNDQFTTELSILERHGLAKSTYTDIYKITRLGIKAHKRIKKLKNSSPKS